MKMACGARRISVIGFLIAMWMLASGSLASAVDTLFTQQFDTRDQVNRDPPTGRLTVSNGIAQLYDLRAADQLQSVSPPVWTLTAKGEAPANSYLELRIKAPQGTAYWLDLVNKSNQSVATIDLQPGTGHWQKHRVRFSGQFGSAGDDLFIRAIRQDSSVTQPVEIDYITIVKGDGIVATASNRPDQANNLALARHECIVLSSSFADLTDRYTNKLIDGDAATYWRTFPGVLTPHWVELRWEYPIVINQLWLRPAPGESPARLGIQIPDGDHWQTLKDFIAPPLWPTEGVGIAIEPITTDRLRITLQADESAAISLAEIEAYGPPQPIVARLRPYWSASYIWYPEPDQIVKNDKRFFRKEFEVKDLSKVTSAFLQTRSNDGYVAYLNGHEVAAGSITITPVDVKSVLKQGTNCLSFEARPVKDPGWAYMTLLSELTINAGDDSQLVITDPTFRCHTQAVEGWKTAGFDDSHWAAAFVCAQPPDEPWGRIPYFDVAESQVFTVSNIITLQATAADTVEVPIELATDHAPGQDLLLIVKAGEIEINSDRSNYLAGSATHLLPKEAWSSDNTASIKVPLKLSQHAPALTVPIRLEMLGTARIGSMRILSPSADQSPNVVGQLSIARADAPVANDASSPASVQVSNGVSRLKIGDALTTPFLWALQSPSLDRYGAYSNTGIDLFHVQIYPYRIEPNADYQKLHLKFVDQHIRHLLAINPHAKILVEMDLRDSAAWAEANPDERLLTAQGVKKAASFASRVYAQDVADYVRTVVRFMQSQPYANSVIGYIPEIAEPESAMGGSDQNAFQPDRLKLNIGDYNPQAIEYFRQFLRDKYGNSVDALRTAWKDPAVTFDTAEPILEDLTREGDAGGLFRDPSKGRMPFDYFECLSTMVPRFVLENVGKVIKEETNNRALVGFYYGYTVETLRSVCNPGMLLQGNHFYFDQVIDSPYIDFYMSPLQYEHRLAGDRMFPFQPVDSIRLHNKLYVAEEDIRTYISGLTSYGRQRSDQESVAVMRNHLGAAVIHGSGAWMADWSSGSGLSRTAVPFFKTPELLDTITDIKQIYDNTAATHRESAAQIAVFVSPKTMYYHDVAYASVLYNSLICELLYKQMPRIGAPFDTFSIEDVAHDRVQNDYKLYVFLNAYYTESAERAAIEKLKREGKTLLFFYAPDYVSNEAGLSAENVSAITGINISVTDDKRIQSCETIAGDHPLLAGIKPATTYAAFGFDYNPTIAALHPTEYGPTFTVNDPSAEPLATFNDGGVAFAAKDHGDWKTVYSSVPYLDALALRNIARWAGVHLYTEESIVVEASNDFVLLHSGHDRDRKLNVQLPAPSNVSDAYTGKPIARNTTEIEVDLPKSTTVMYHLEPAASSQPER